jgi:hypothetical protein
LFENTAASVHGYPLFQPNVIVAAPSVILDNGTVGSQTIYTNNTSAKVRVAAPLEWGSWSDELLSNPSFEMGNLTGWTAMGPAAASVEVFNATSGGDIYTQRNLRVGSYGVCTKDTPGTSDDSGVWQNVSLTAYTNAIDAGNAVMNASAWLYPSEWTWDDCALIVRFYNSSGGFISAWNTTGEYGIDTAYNPKAWMLGSGYAHFIQGQLKQFGCYNYTIPAGTRTVGIQLGMGEHKDPAYCGGQADEASIKIRTISLPVYYPSDYSVPTGAYVSGVTPSSIQTVDSDYFIVRSLPATSTTAYNPSGYSTLGSTTLVSGATSDLVSDNDGYMTYRSYVSSSSTASNTSAFVAYRDSTTSLNTPKGRVWDGAAWGSQSEMPTSGSPVRYVRTACCPIEQRSCENMVVTLSDDGYLDAYVWDGTTWNVTSDIGQCWSTATSDARRPYDVAYMSDGQALLLYGTTVSGGTNDLAYRVWTFGSGWGPEQYYDDAGHASKITVTTVDVASGLNSRMGATYIDNINSDANAMIWNGSSWVDQLELTGAVAIAAEEAIGITAELLTGNIVAVAGQDQYVKWAKYSSGSWSSVDMFDINSGATGVMNWLKLASSESNRIVLTSVDGSNDLCTALLDDNTIGNRQFGTASQSIGSMTATTSITGLRFTAQASKSVSSFSVYIQAVLDSPTYAFGIEYVGSNYIYNGTYVGGTSNYVNATPTATGWLNITLPSVASLTSGTVYCITVRYMNGTIGTSNYIALRRIGAVPSSWRVSENTIDPWLNTISTGTVQARDPIFILSFNDTTYETMPFESSSYFTVYTTNWVSQKWNQTGTETIYGVNIPVIENASPTSLNIVLRNVTGSADLLNLTISASEITTTFLWYEKLFSSPITLYNGIQYRLIIQQSAGSSTNRYRVYYSSTTQSGDYTYRGNESVYSTSTTSGSSWTDINTNDLICTLLVGQTDMNSWVIHTPWDTGVDTNSARCADFAWEFRNASESANYRNQGLLVYGTTSGSITWRRFRAPNYMTVVASPSMTGTHPWVQLVSNQRTVSGDALILGAVLDSSFELGAVLWDGTTFSILGNNSISSNTVVSTYECFRISYQRFGPPAEFTSEVELTGTSNTESWTQLAWSVDSALTTDSVMVTIQVYNYTEAGGYPASGDGYDTYTSNPIANTDETRNQAITTNPTCFQDGSGNWRIKIMAVKSTATQFDFKVDWIEFKPTHYTDCTVSTEFLLSSMTTNTPSQLSFTVVSQYDIASVNIIIQAWNYSSSTYDTSGEGYMNYISSGSNETKLLSISTNPQFMLQMETRK